jgi:hypothetical protein
MRCDQAPELVHGHFTDERCGDFAAAVGGGAHFDFGDELFELGDGDAALAARFTDACQQLLAVEVLAAAILLHHLDGRELHRLNRAEAFATGDTLAPPADAIVVGTAIRYLRVTVLAVGAPHFLP